MEIESFDDIDAGGNFWRGRESRVNQLLSNAH